MKDLVTKIARGIALASLTAVAAAGAASATPAKAQNSFAIAELGQASADQRAGTGGVATLAAPAENIAAEKAGAVMDDADAELASVPAATSAPDTADEASSDPALNSRAPNAAYGSASYAGAPADAALAAR